MTIIQQLEEQCREASRDRREAEKELNAMPMSEINTPAGRAVIERIQAAGNRFKNATIEIGKRILHD